MHMQDVHLPPLEALDLNLLVALRALLVEGHVTKAAARVGLSQPAMSHALARLRELLGDPLLVRTATGMKPTARAESMRLPLERALEDLGRALASPAPFDPRLSTRKFRIATNDYMELVLLPRLLARLWAEAPGIDVRLTNLADRANEDLTEGRIDFAMGVVGELGAPDVPQGIRSQRLVSDGFVCVVREGHPVVKKRLSLDDFIALPHALVAPRGTTGSVVDSALQAIGKKRRVAVEVPHFLVAPHVVRETDVVLTLAKRVALVLGPLLGLRQLAPPLELPGFTMTLLWHERQHADPAHAWLRSLMTSVAKST
ncbi:MAG: Transcriptional regulator [Labilithrix sp.]|nr:Transcriptional regulator [Labilithrix sp.]